MPDVNPMTHMDPDYMWRWYVTNANGGLLCMSTESFFNHEDALRDFDSVRRQFRL
jgi:hypothetical protein